eukprot:s419_g27.t1
MRLFSLVLLVAAAPRALAASARNARCEECAQLAKRVEQLEALLSAKADVLEMLSTAQVRDGLKKLTDGSLQQLDGALESMANVSKTLQSSDLGRLWQSIGSTTEYLVELPSLSSVLWLIAVGFSMMMAFLSLCIVLGESKVNHERLQALESRAVTGQEQQPQPKAICDSRLLALEAGKPHAYDCIEVLSGAVGAAIGSTTGAISGTAVGGTVGAAIGLVPAVFTFGLSIPVGAFIGSSLGFASGGVVGGSAGAFGGVKAAKLLRKGRSRSFSADSMELAEHMATAKDRATFSAAIQAALKALEKHPGNAAVQKAARGALQSLSAFDKDGLEIPRWSLLPNVWAALLDRRDGSKWPALGDAGGSGARAECRVEPACGAVYTWLAYRYPVPAGESQFGVEEEMTYEVKLHSCTRVLKLTPCLGTRRHLRVRLCESFQMPQSQFLKAFVNTETCLMFLALGS